MRTLPNHSSLRLSCSVLVMFLILASIDARCSSALVVLAKVGHARLLAEVYVEERDRNVLSEFRHQAVTVLLSEPSATFHIQKGSQRQRALMRCTSQSAASALEVQFL